MSFLTWREVFLDGKEYTAAMRWPRRCFRAGAGQDTNEWWQARLTLLSHGLEKGMTFPFPRRPFGLQRISDIEDILEEAAEYGASLDVESSMKAVLAAEQFNKIGSIDDTISPYSNWNKVSFRAQDIEEFIRTRHSVRNFDPARGVDTDQIRKVVEWAGTTPSVCNRRSYRAHFYDDVDSIREVLSLQNGNHGFAETVRGLFIVTVRRSSFRGPGERNQRWIDGGLFAMSLVWLLHASGIGACFLNWSETHSKTAKLRLAAEIPEDEDVVVLVAVGHPAETHRVAASPKRRLEDIYTKH